jgi:formylglycine-generating enzyme required for sulfatase activity
MMKMISIQSSLFILFLSCLFFAQNTNELRIQEDPKFLPNQIIDIEVRDNNGSVCAGLIILSDIPGLTYDSNNGIVKVNHKEGEDFLFLSPDERVIKIYGPEYIPLQIVLSNYDIFLKSGNVWQIKVTGDKIGDVIPITLITKPSGSNIFIDGNNKGKGTVFQVTKGEHQIKIERTGNKTLIDTIFVDNENVIFSYELDISQLQVVTISSSPDSAEVLIDGENIGTTNMQRFLSPGKYTLTFLKDGFISVDLEISVMAGKDNVFHKELKKLAPSVGDLQFSIKPFEAFVKLFRENKFVDEWSGLKIISNLEVGNYTIYCYANGHNREKREVVIKQNEITVINVNLQIDTTIQDMILIVGGTFIMGNNKGSSDERPEHEVSIGDFYISKYEVTFEEYDKYCYVSNTERPDDEGWGRGGRPVVNVTWYDALAYCEWLSEEKGKKYRLPTEAEWEYASRGGNQSKGFKYSGSNDIKEVGWVWCEMTHEVGIKHPNELGIYDMSGNVWEWCSDWYSSNYYVNSTNNYPTGPINGSSRVLRGGSWDIIGQYSRSARRENADPTSAYNSVGFRIVREVL